MTFTTRRKVRFQHCDPAGIVFYPRYFEMINSVVEDWFAEVVEHDFNRLHVESGTGVPTASIETRFHAPSRLGEVLEFRLTPLATGRTSLKLRVTAYRGDERRLTSDSTLVFVDLASGRPLPWPDAMRRHFAMDSQ
ncbi:acyl-CoA thioesterase [Billgrantia endophytica]|uniref:Thioesterase n=1 Tax=Billgrantia endophytica TaxID=2033802 RepID=A0A2N7TY99_9GAMM|nr:thioesterase family protein [Halomonas endophytica]PMR73149.1 thioesterase [Halomonas endophytica]